jgi:hypothetical protein
LGGGVDFSALGGGYFGGYFLQKKMKKLVCLPSRKEEFVEILGDISQDLLASSVAFQLSDNRRTWRIGDDAGGPRLVLKYPGTLPEEAASALMPFICATMYSSSSYPAVEATWRGQWVATQFGYVWQSLWEREKVESERVNKPPSRQSASRGPQKNCPSSSSTRARENAGRRGAEFYNLFQSYSHLAICSPTDRGCHPQQLCPCRGVPL